MFNPFAVIFIVKFTDWFTGTFNVYIFGYQIFI